MNEGIGDGGCTSFWHLRRRFSVDVDVAGLGGGIVRFWIWGILRMKMGVVLFSVVVVDDDDDGWRERWCWCWC